MSNLHDEQYIQFLARLSARYRTNTEAKPVFMTNVDHEKLWKLYLDSFTLPQYHNCMTCHSFLNHYGGLVVLDKNGDAKSALWDPIDSQVPEEKAAIVRLRNAVEEAKISGVFYSSEPMLGRMQNGGWLHFAVENPNVFISTVPGETASQAMAKKHEEFTNVLRAIKEYSPTIIEQAQALVTSGKLFRAERVQAPLQWLADLQKGAKPRTNAVWMAVATAPVGLTHARSSMSGTLLKDIAANLPAKDIIERFNAKMDEYQRPKAAPKVGQINEAEKAVQQLGIAPAFERRYTTMQDLENHVLWSPRSYEERAEYDIPKTSGLFSDLRPQPAVTNDVIVVPPKVMTWEKFALTVLPTAAKIEYRVPLVGRFCALTTAVNMDAPPILQWDAPHKRNPVAWCFSDPPANAEEWNLVPGKLVQVLNIVDTPNLWGPTWEDYGHHGKGAILLLEGARDTRNLPGGGLFTEHLRSELKSYRATIDAHMNRLTVHGAADSSTLAFGIGLLQGNDWTESAAPPTQPSATQGKAPDFVHVLLVIDDSGSMASYIQAARQALQSLISAVSSMPGKVDVTIIKFGTHVHTLCERQPLAELVYVTDELNGSSGNTALNDAIGKAITLGKQQRVTQNSTFFLGIVTDGEENHSKNYNKFEIHDLIHGVLRTGQWTVAMAGAGSNPWSYAREIGIPEGNFTKFEASARGFKEVGARYAASTRSLAREYKTGARATTSFFSAVSGRKPIGTDLPVLLVTNRDGRKTAYSLDRWE